MAELPYIPLSTPNLSGREREYVLDCVDTTWISSVGKYVERFEREFASFVGAPGAVAASSGTAALHLALIATGVKAGEGVFVPALTFIAPVNAVVYVGATPVFIDCEEEGFGLSAKSIESYIEDNCFFDGETLADRRSGLRITAMIPVHLMGRACEMDSLLALASKYHLKVVEDAAEGIGCLYKGRHVGSYGLVGCFSFNGNKTLTTGGGGMAVSADPALLKRMKHLSTQAKSDELLFEHDETGYNYRMNNIQAALGVGQLEHLESMIGRKRAIHEIYAARFTGLKTMRLMKESSSCRSACWMAVVKTESRERRDALVSHCGALRIQARPFWALNSGHPMYKGCPRAALPVATELVERCVSIPCASKMSDMEVERVVSAVLAFDSSCI